MERNKERRAILTAEERDRERARRRRRRNIELSRRNRQVRKER